MAQAREICGNTNHQTIEALSLRNGRAISERYSNVNVRLTIALARNSSNVVRNRLVDLVVLPQKRARPANTKDTLAPAREVLDRSLIERAIGDNLYLHESRLGRDVQSN